MNLTPLFRLKAAAALALCMAALYAPAAWGAWVWVEGEKPVKSSMNRHPWWYDQVNRGELSGGDFTSNFNKDKVGEAEYAVEAPEAGSYDFWVRTNPVGTRLSYRLGGGEWTEIDMKRNAGDSLNIAADGKLDIRFIAWVKAGKVDLKKGANTVAFRMDSANSNHGMIDCFIFTTEPFKPMGKYKPDEIADAARRLAEENKGWFAFDPKPDPYDPASAIDLRRLNERQAGDGGFIGAKGGDFIHSKTGKPVRFWGVNGPPADLKDPAAMAQAARLMAKHGVNLARIHGGYFDQDGNVKPEAVKHAIALVEALKAEGIYAHLSIYFPLWLSPKPDSPWLRGYDGKKHPFALLYFDKDFQAKYREWWKALLTTPSEKTGKRLADDPAVAGAEIINEDSFFFWTFTPENVPDPELRPLEARFGDWLKARYGSLDAALEKWQGLKTPRDNLAEGRMGFRPLWNMFTDRRPRDADTARFLLEVQRGFYQDTYKYLRGLGFKGVITCSNWATASPQYFGPLEKYSYTAGDFIDRHGYFGCNHKGDNAAWSVRNGHTYADRSALRFEPEVPGKPKLFEHPAMDPHYNGLPSMISETTFCRPNRYRSEAPLFYAAYGALQHSDAIVHFAMDSSRWVVKPGYFMQPWTIVSPAMMGQFPAAALIYREGLVAPGETLVDLNLKIEDLLNLKGTPLPQDAAFDELRLKDVPQGTTLQPGNVIDPLVHLAGRTNVRFTAEGGPPALKDLAPLVDRAKSTVTASTGQLKLDYAKGVLVINAPAAQGVSGALRDAGPTDLKDVAIASDLELGHIVAVSLDGLPLVTSRRILLQAMSEEKNGKFQTAPAGAGKRIVSIGQDPWMVKELAGTVKLKRPDAARLKVTALDFNGYPAKDAGTAAEIKLLPDVVYYLITP